MDDYILVFKERGLFLLGYIWEDVINNCFNNF